MPQRATSPNFLARLTDVEARLARVERAGNGQPGEVPFYPTHYETLAYADGTTFSTVWESTITPRGSALSMEVITLGDQVGTVNTGGAWQMLLNGSVTWSGTVLPTFTLALAQKNTDLTPYLGADLHIELQVRTTSGATTGGRYGRGGSIGISPVYARLL